MGVMQAMLQPYGSSGGVTPPTPRGPASQPSPGMGLGQMFQRLRQSAPGIDVEEAVPGMNVPMGDPVNIRNSQAPMPPTSLNDAGPVGPQLLDQQDQSRMGGMPGPLDTMTQPNMGRPMDGMEIDELRQQLQQDLSKDIAGNLSPQDRVFSAAKQRGLSSFKANGQANGQMVDRSVGRSVGQSGRRAGG